MSRTESKMPGKETNLTRSVADWVATSTEQAIAGHVVDRAKRHIMDTIGVAIAGANTRATRVVHDYGTSQDVGGKTTVLGWAGQVGAPTAALVNGVSAHALDFDDQSYSILGHASAVVLPAALAAAEDAGASGRSLVDGYLVGMEVACRLGQALNPRLFQRGWHTTGVLGALGASASCASLWHLTAEQTSNALGLAVVRAGGLRANNGSLAKAYQAGQAAQAGVVSAQLASCGLDASPDILGAPDGFVQLFNDNMVSREPLTALGSPFDMSEPGIMVKRYPACSGIAAALDALFHIRSSASLDPDNVDEVHCTLTPLGFHSLPIRIPDTPYQGKFSAPFCLAAALVAGNVDLNTFSGATLNDPRVRRLMENVRLSYDSSRGWAPVDAPEAATVTVVTKDGRRLECHRNHPLGCPPEAMSDSQIEAKFLACVSPVLGASRATSLLRYLCTVDDQPNLTPIADLTAGCNIAA